MTYDAETFSTLSTKAKNLVQTLNWQIYHTPENLTLFLLGEASELGEYCQWLSEEEIKGGELFGAVRKEIADVVKNVLYIVNVLQLSVSLEKVLLKKIELDERRYPVCKFECKSKYHVEIEGNRSVCIEPIPQDDRPDKPTIQEIQCKAWRFVKDRCWERFYSPASLALAIEVKSGEVATCYQRRPKAIRSPYERMIWALADILLNVLRLCSFLGICDLFQVVEEKLDSDEARFQQKDI